MNELIRPRILFSAINGGSGKTFITTGIIAALSARGLKVQAFKKGPDYIDVKWHSLASGRKSYNLDLYMFKDHVMNSLAEKSADADISIIEGNHGLYDSIDSEGMGSTAYLARYTQSPVILIINCQKMSRSVAALINGFVNFEKDTNIVGVILNQVSGKRHEEKIVESINRHCAIPVLGVVRKTNQVNLEQRHLGIITTEDKIEAQNAVEELKNIAEKSIQLDKILEVATLARPLPKSSLKSLGANHKHGSGIKNLTIAVARDAAFNFYYPDNLEFLEAEGARLVYFSPIHDDRVPESDGLYIGGGYPEIYARELADNKAMRNHIAALIESNLPVFAECGGLMYMTQKIIWNGMEHDMVGVIAAQSVMHKKPQGKGYVELEVLQNNEIESINSGTSEIIDTETRKSFWEIPKGIITKAHEFHYSILENLPESTTCVFSMNRGTGITNNTDGILYKNMLATYTHFHSLAAPWFAPAFANACRMYKENLTAKKV